MANNKALTPLEREFGVNHTTLLAEQPVNGKNKLMGLGFPCRIVTTKLNNMEDCKKLLLAAMSAMMTLVGYAENIVEAQLENVPDGSMAILYQTEGDMGIGIAKDTILDGKFHFSIPCEEGGTKKYEISRHSCISPWQYNHVIQR